MSEIDTTGGMYVSADPNSDVREYIHYNEVDDTITQQRVQDIEPILDNVKQLREFGGRGETGEFYHAAQVPVVVVENWLNLRGLSMSQFKGSVVTEFLNDTDNKPFRVWQGRV